MAEKNELFRHYFEDIPGYCKYVLFFPIKGRGPEKRCMHTMNFMFNMSLCVIYGGKYESASSTKYYDDLFVLNLKSLAWIEVS